MHRRPILVVEDHQLSASLLLELLGDAFPARPLHLAACVSQACAEFARLQPSLLLIEIGVPGLRGLDVMRRIATADPQATVVVYTTNDSGSMRDAATAAGARAFVSKSNPRELLRVLNELLDRGPSTAP
jgi:DNA-binding NarL/FixJ family response regulator